MIKIYLNKNLKERIKRGYPWIFSNEIVQAIDCEPGEIVEVFSRNGEHYGLGFYNRNSLIAIRLLFTFDYPNIDFFVNRIRNALTYRVSIFFNIKAFRLIYGETDLLPGLIVDKYNNYLSFQILSAGMERLKSSIVQALMLVLPEIKGIYEKNLSYLRKLEDLPSQEGIVYGIIPDEIEISENNVRYAINLKKSQKTGFYFDQRLNRLFIQSIARDKKVLDCYCNQGGFALNSALGGASEVIGIDSSSTAIGQANKNAILNNFRNIDFVKADVEEYLKLAIKNDYKWDLIILDPPAFAKSKKDVSSALKEYKKINNLAIKALNNYGFLASSSCSQHIFEDIFLRLICEETQNNNKIPKLVFRGQQSPDHPILTTMPETKYLKFFVLSLVNK